MYVKCRSIAQFLVIATAKSAGYGDGKKRNFF